MPFVKAATIPENIKAHAAALAVMCEAADIDLLCVLATDDNTTPVIAFKEGNMAFALATIMQRTPAFHEFLENLMEDYNPQN